MAMIHSRTQMRSPVHSVAASVGHHRRGSAYLAVMGTTLIVATLSMGALVSVRAQYRSSKGAGDAAEAQLLAGSGIEMARRAIFQDANWRTTYSGTGWQSEMQVSPGKYVTWKLLDASTAGSVLHAGANPQSDTAQIRIYGKGRVGDAVQMRSVAQTSTKIPYTGMLSALHANGNVSLAAGSGRSFTASGAKLSTNGTFTNGVTYVGDVDAQVITNTGTISGIQTVTATAKTVPPDSVWNIYQPLATSIPWNTTVYFYYNSAKVQYQPKTNILSPTMSNFTTPVTNVDGVYLITVPSGIAKIQFDWVRVNGTILFDCQGTSTTIHLGGHILWTPARPDYPMIIVRNALAVELDAQGTGTGFTLDENTNNNTAGASNYNPVGFPYSGVQDADVLDSYESRLFGVIHIMGGVGATPTATTIFTKLRVTGCIIAPGTVTYPGGSATPIDATLTWDSALLSNPPLGYYTQSMSTSANTWRQEILP